MPTVLLARIAFLVVFTAAAAAWLCWVQRRVRPGATRCLAAAPVISAFLLAPLLFDPATETSALIASINLPWLSNTVVRRLGWVHGASRHVVCGLEHASIDLSMLCPPSIRR